MKLKILISMLLIAAMLMASPSLAKAQKISLPEAFQRLEKNNPNLQKSALQKLTAQAGVAIEKTNVLPSVFFQSSYQYVSEVAKIELPFKIPGAGSPEIEAGVNNQYDFSALVQQPLFTGFRLKNQRKLAHLNEQQTQVQEKQLLNRLKAETAKIFYQIHAADQSLAVIETGINRINAQRTLIQNLYQAGQTEAFDTLKIKSEYLRLLTQKKQVTHRRAMLLTAFNALLNSDTPLDVGGYKKNSINPPLKFEDYFEEAMQLRPELTQINLQKKASLVSQKIVQSAYFPQISGQLSYHYGKPGVDFFKNEWMNYYRVGVQLNWKIWDWKRTHQRSRQAVYQQKMLTAEENQMILNIKNEIKRALENLKSELEVRSLKRQILKQEKERYRLVKSRFELGQATTLDLTDAENSLRAAEIAYTQNHINLLIQQIELDYATGKIGQY